MCVTYGNNLRIRICKYIYVNVNANERKPYEIQVDCEHNYTTEEHNNTIVLAQIVMNIYILLYSIMLYMKRKYIHVHMYIAFLLS